MAWFRRDHAGLSPGDVENRVPEGLWVKCGSCKELIYRKEVVKNLSVCPKCSFHFRISARERLEILFDGDWLEFDEDLVSADPLKFTDDAVAPGCPNCGVLVTLYEETSMRSVVDSRILKAL